MTIDIEKLKVDESLWPEGAERFGPDDGLFVAGWYKSENGKTYFMPADESEWRLTCPMDRTTITRPEPRQVEWSDNRPPVGVRCEIHFKDCNETHPFDVLAHDDGVVVGFVDQGPCGFYDGYDPEQCPEVEFRPIRTKEQRNREETIGSAIMALGTSNRFIVDHRKVLGILYDAGLLRKGDDQ